MKNNPIQGIAIAIGLSDYLAVPMRQAEDLILRDYIFSTASEAGMSKKKKKI